MYRGIIPSGAAAARRRSAVLLKVEWGGGRKFPKRRATAPRSGFAIVGLTRVTVPVPPLHKRRGGARAFVPPMRAPLRLFSPPRFHSASLTRRHARRRPLRALPAPPAAARSRSPSARCTAGPGPWQCPRRCSSCSRPPSQQGNGRRPRRGKDGNMSALAFIFMFYAHTHSRVRSIPAASDIVNQLGPVHAPLLLLHAVLPPYLPGAAVWICTTPLL